MDLTDRKLLNLAQGPFPLADRPYLKLGEELEIGEREVIDRLSELKRQNVLRQISAIFDTRRLGYKTTLVAMAHDQDKLHEGALRINRHPGVSHNYAREGSYYNLWFTLAVPPDHDLEATVERMARDTGALDARLMPTIRFFKIGVAFDMVGQNGSSDISKPVASTGAPPKDWNEPVPLSEADKAAIRELQEDLHLTERPFDGMAGRLGMTTAELLALAVEFQERGIMRRYSAVLHHRRSGFRANAMIVWKVPPERSEEVGAAMARHPAVTHCYERPTFPDWPYTHFTMVHATSPEGCEKVGREIGEATGITERAFLYSTREYKKTRVRYFVEDTVEQTVEDTVRKASTGTRRRKTPAPGTNIRRA
jgi:DNA-binding Lrp family transcriptional regulator